MNTFNPLNRRRPERHGHTRRGVSSREYTAWRNAKARCFNPKYPDFHCYGGRGITMCSEWRDSFCAFFEHMGKCPQGYELDRIDVNGNYEPGNCQWATERQQSLNSRRNCYIEFKGETKPLSEWARILGGNYHTIKSRLYRGWGVEETFSHELCAPGCALAGKQQRNSLGKFIK